MQVALFGLWLALAAPEAAPPPAPETAAPASEPAKAPSKVDVNSDTPPPSTYDRTLAEKGEPGAAPQDEGRTLLSQVFRTILSLGFVVALIYGLSRLGLARLGKMRGGGGAAGLRVIERLQLDPKHALFVVEVSGKQRFLVGAGGDKGVSYIATLAEPPAGAPSFESALEKAQDESSVSPPEAPRGST